MFTATPPRSSITADKHKAAAAAAITLHRKRARPDQLFQPSSPALVQGQFQGHVNNDICTASDTSSSPSSRGNPTAMVSPFIDHRTSNTNVGGIISSSPSPMTARLEPLIECAPSEELPEMYTKEQQQQQLPLSQTSFISTTSSITTFASSIPNNADHYHSDYYYQPPMKRVKVDQGGTNSNDEEFQDVVIPLEECHHDEEMTPNSPDLSRSTKSSSNSLMKKLMESGNASVLRRKTDASSSTSGVVCCHVCGGQGDSDTKHVGSKSGGCINSSNNIGGGSCASRSIASYFQVTKKQSSSSKLPPQPSTPSLSCKKASSHQTTITTSPSDNDNLHLPPCRYCDRPTCNNNPSCIKQCEECQHNFCSFCCKVNYDGMYEKTVCFECDELLMLSHCCDRMEL
eukprot:CAMPEP_0201714026 /NCGR_PEP_ID=MMETSP0593-20130828/656_1 /ASSEMBLY_ACC=CAM_ASM_000672 /TAXON_ID=267983 /ORGANISM="Skeletonema japonicum, Strain CCMP2506" /LENGTH=399 /DNA_ID=CAMNT_0048203251 /DNA_START=129 /DNA_END=1328 /DNA_ORIENTATION=-